MKLKEKLSVCVVTHIIDANTNPYIENEMIGETIRSSHQKMGLEDVKYYVYIDSTFKQTHSNLYDEYEKYLIKLFSDKTYDNINIEIVKDSKQLLRGNYIDCVSRCKTPYMLFLEHDWEFVNKIPTKNIIKTLDNYEFIKYFRFNRFTDKKHFWDKMFEHVNDLDIPITKITYFSGNPHIIRTKTFIDEYLPVLYEFYPDGQTKGTSHFEKEFYSIINEYINKFGVEKTNQYWGTYCYEHFPCNLHVRHLGDWCRKR